MRAGNRNFAAYTHLPSGKYTFRVKASRNFSSDDAPVTSLVIIIHPPFWRTPWFIGLCILLLAAALYGLYRYRISQLIRLQKVRNRIASDLHDDIGSALTHISILSELSKSGVPPSAETALFLDRISEEVASSGQALDDIVWSINSNNDTMEQTVARMRRYAAEILETKVDKYVVDFDDRFAHRKFNMEQRRDFFLLFKEVISNIYKHSKATQVEIRVWFERNNLHLEVKDNGVGFDKTRATERNGIKNMQARAEKWNGQFLIHSEPGKGTQTTISMPVA
jgi:signal transduction histidine kinase